MEESVRNSLIIISAIIIGGIFVHGLWTIRKNKNPYKLKAKPKDIEVNNHEEFKRDFDPSGFDQDGVSQVKVVGKNTVVVGNNSEAKNVADEANVAFNTAKHEAIEDNPFVNDSNYIGKNIEPAHNSDVAEHQNKQALKEQVLKESAEVTTAPKTSDTLLDDELDFSLDINVVAQDDLPLNKDLAAHNDAENNSVYSDPVSKPKPKVKKQPRKAIKKPTKAELARDQMEINFGDAENIDTNDEPSPTPNTTNNIESEVLAISVVVPQGQIISGAALLPSLLTLGMKYGEMNIFHRHQDNAGNGKVTFSLANALNPGTFDLDNMENFVTQGVSLFMTLPNAGDPFAVFDQMLVAAKQLALEFNGQLLDDKRSVLTKQTEQHYITKIREFERKSRLASL